MYFIIQIKHQQLHHTSCNVSYYFLKYRKHFSSTGLVYCCKASLVLSKYLTYHNITKYKLHFFCLLLFIELNIDIIWKIEIF